MDFLAIIPTGTSGGKILSIDLEDTLPRVDLSSLLLALRQDTDHLKGTELYWRKLTARILKFAIFCLSLLSINIEEKREFILMI